MLNLTHSIPNNKVSKTHGRHAAMSFLTTLGYSVGEKFFVSRSTKDSTVRSHTIYIATLGDKNFTIEETRRDSTGNGWVGTGIVKPLGWEYLESWALKGQNINIYAQTFEGGIKNEHVKNVKFFLLESDTNTLEAQINNIESLATLGLEPCVVSFTGGKSLHAYYNIGKIEADNADKDLAYRLASILYGADISLKAAAKPFRFPTFSRIRNGETKTCDLVYLNSDNHTSVEEIVSVLKSQWKFTHPLTDEREKFYSKIVKNNTFIAAGSDNIDINLPSNPTDAFEWSDDEVRLAVHGTLDVKASGQFGTGKGGKFDIKKNAAGAMISKLLIPKYMEQSLDYQYNLFNHNFQRGGSGNVALMGRSPFSATNSSGTTFKVFKNGGWCCHSSNEGGGILQYILELKLGTLNPTGEQLYSLAEWLCEILGVNYVAEIARFESSFFDFYLESDADIEDDRRVELQLNGIDPESDDDNPKILEDLENFEIFYPTETLESGNLDNSKSYIVLDNSELSQNVADKHNCKVISVKRVDISIKNAVTGKAIVIPEPGQIRKGSWRLFAGRIVENIDNVRFAWYGQSEVDSQNFLEFSNNLTLVNFEKLNELFRAMVSKAAHMKTYNDLSQTIIDSDEILDWEYVSDLPQPKAGMVTVIDSGMGTGKTEYLARICENSDFRKIISLGYRNGLLDNSAARTGLTLLAKLKGETGVKGISLCLDSFPKLSKSDFYGTLIVFDEFQAVLEHLITANTEVSKNRATTIIKLVEYIKYALETGGAVLAMEAKITNCVFRSFFIEILGLNRSDIWVIKNTRQKSHFNAAVYTKSYHETLVRLAEDIASGKPCLVASDSVEMIDSIVDAIELINLAEYKKLVISSDTIDQHEVKAFLENAQTATDDHHYTCVIYSPTLESGGDITHSHYQKMYGFFTNASTRSITQMLGRLRTNVEREIYIADSFNLSTGGFDVEEHFRNSINSGLVEGSELHDTIKNLTKSLVTPKPDTYDVISDLKDENSILSKFMRLRSAMIVASNISKKYMAEILISTLRSDGHNVSVETGVKDEIIGAYLTEIKDLKKVKKTRELWNADISGMTPEMADKILSQATAKKADRVRARKFKIIQSYPGMGWDMDKLRILFIEDKGETINICRERFYLENPEIAKNVEVKSWEHQLKQEGVWLPDVNTISQRVEFYLRHNIIPRLAEMSQNGHIHAESVELKRLMFEVLKDKEEVKRLFKFSMTTDPIKLFNKFLSRVGMKLEKEKQIVEGNKRVRIYQLTEDSTEELRNEVLESMKLYYDDSTKSAQRPIQLSFEGVKVTNTKTTIIYNNDQCSADQLAEDEIDLPDVNGADLKTYLEISDLVADFKAGELELGEIQSRMLKIPENLRKIYGVYAKDELSNAGLWEIFA